MRRREFVDRERLIEYILLHDPQYKRTELDSLSERQLIFIKVRIELELLEKSSSSQR